MKNLLLSFVVAVIFLLNACSPSADGPLRVGTNQWPGYEPLYLARSLGVYDKQQIRLVEFPSATDVMHALQSDLLHVAALTLDEAILMASEGEALSIILITDISDGADVIMARPGIDSILSLEKLRIGVESTALGAFMLQSVLEAAQLKLEDVQIVPLTVAEHLQAYKEGRVDAVVTFEPVVSQLKAEGAEVLFSSSEIPGEIVDVLVVKSALLESRPHQLQALLDGWFQAITYLNTKPAQAHAIMAPRLGLSTLELAEAYAGLLIPKREDNLKQLAQQGALIRQVKRFERLMLSNGLITRLPTTSIQTRTDFVQE